MNPICEFCKYPSDVTPCEKCQIELDKRLKNAKPFSRTRKRRPISEPRTQHRQPNLVHR